MSPVPDPVLVRLGDWAKTRSLSRQAMADALGVKRPTVAGWMLGLEAIERGEDMPLSGREFRFANQRPEVQQGIAEVLGVPVDLLRVEAAGLNAASDSRGAPAAGNRQALAGSELAGIVRSILGDIVLGGMTGTPDGIGGGGSLRHRIADIVESVEGVAATAVVAVPRGRVRTAAYQHQIAVLAEPWDVQNDRTVTAYLRDVRLDVERALGEAALSCAWEHGVHQPDFQITRNGRRLLTLGSLVCPAASGSMPPRTGLLAYPRGHEATATGLRVGAVVTSPYGGSGPIGGFLGHALGVGHLRANETIRSVRNKQARQRVGTGERGAVLSPGARRDGGFVLHGVLHLLERGDLPGAWLLSLETAQLEYGPLRQALVHLDGLVVTAHLGPLWRRFAAWRLATAGMNETVGPEALRNTAHPVSSDWMDTTGALADGDRAVLEAQTARAADELVRLELHEMLLETVVAERRSAGLPVVSVRLDELPADVAPVRWSKGRFHPAYGDERTADGVIFPDQVDGMVDVWTDVAVTAMDEIASLTGHRSADDLVDPRARHAVATALRLRRQERDHT